MADLKYKRFLATRSSHVDAVHAMAQMAERFMRVSSLRLRVADETGVLSRITTILAENDISIDAVLQRESLEGERQTDLIILTHTTVEEKMDRALEFMQSLPSVLAPIARIRKEDLA